MNRIAFFVDGFNLYHSLDSDPSYYKYKWLNLDKLAHCFVTSHDKVEKVFYFTTYATWNQVKLVKHQIYVRALQFVGVEAVFGALGMPIKPAEFATNNTKLLKKSRQMLILLSSFFKQLFRIYGILR